MENLHRLDISQEAADFVDRLCRHHGSKTVAAEVDRGYSAVRSWVSDPERLPLTKLPELWAMADRDDPFLHRLASLLGYRLLPLFPTADQIVAALEEAGALKRGSQRTARRVIRGLDRQGRLWGE